MLPVDSLPGQGSMRPGPTSARRPHAQVDRPGKKEAGEAKKKGGRPPPGPRIVKLEGGREVEGLQGNNVKTAKYNVVTFLPIFLFEMFSRIAYLYFMLQARRAPPAFSCRLGRIMSPSMSRMHVGMHALSACVFNNLIP